MKKLKFWSVMLLVAMSLPVFIACGDDEEEGAKDSELINQAIGTWMCTKSLDSAKGVSLEGLMVGKEITIKSDGTYTSTSSNFGYEGTYSLKGNVITAKSSNGDTFIVTIEIKGDTMTWSGTASNGTTFKYVFARE